MELEYRVVCRDGSQRWFSTIISARRLDGGILHLYGTTEDVTEKKKAEEQIRLSEIKFRTIVENINDALYLLDFSGTVQDINENACRMLGYSREELIGAHFSIAYGSGNIDHVSECIARVKKQGSHVFDDEHFRKDGSVVSVSVSATLISRERNGVIQAFVRDMSERRRHEAELIRAKEDAERTNRLRAVFLSNMSHEIRTPMHGIIGFARLLRSSLSDEELIDHTDLILKSSERLMTTIDDILDFSRLESKSYSVNLQKHDIIKETEECLSLLLSIAREKGIFLQCDHDGIPVHVDIDSHAYGKVLNNLVGNAFKFTAEGGVTVSITSRDGECQVRVKDTGQGIPEDYYDTIFEEFRQVSEGFSRSHEGSGLGLAISRNLVELMNGRLCVEESAVGEGTTFLIAFPVAGKADKDAGKAMQSPDVRAECDEDRADRRMLFVDDESISILLAKSIFRNRPNYTVDYARSAAEAINLAQCNSYQVILLDIGLGADLDGVQVMKRIREMDTNRNARFVAVTGYAFSEQRMQLSEVFDGYISKPYDSVDIFELLGRLNLPG